MFGTRAQIGSVSHGTMNPEHLIPRFIDLLDDLNEARSLDWQANFENELQATAEYARLTDVLSKIEQRQQRDDYYESEDSDYDLEQLFDELDDFAPDYCYFGAHPGDGSDYGFWISWDSIRDDIHDETILAVADLAEVPDDYQGTVLLTNDHGNATLYCRQSGVNHELWSTV